jgi:hypothetical protein
MRQSNFAAKTRQPKKALWLSTVTKIAPISRPAGEKPCYET